MQPEPFGLDVTVSGEVVVLAVRGEIDVMTAPLLRRGLAQALANPRTRLVIADLGRLDFADLAAVKALLEAARVVQPRGGRVVLRSPSVMVRRMVEVLGLGDRLQLESQPSVDEDGLRVGTRPV